MTKGYPRISAGQNNPEPLQRVMDCLGGTLHQKKSGFWEWSLNGAGVPRIMAMLYPELSPRRQVQIETCLSNQKQREDNPFGKRNRNKIKCPAGHEYDRTEIRIINGQEYSRRSCSICIKRRKRERYHERKLEGV